MLIDTNIIIDLSKGSSEAVGFLTSLPEKPAISAITVAEFYGGLRREQERSFIQRLLATYDVYEVSTPIAVQAGQWRRQFGPSHNADLLDCLIAATAREHGLTLATLNTKHFPMLRDVHRPY